VAGRSDGVCSLADGTSATFDRRFYSLNGALIVPAPSPPMPFEPFERYSPHGTPEQVAEFLIPYIESGCSAFNVIPCASDEKSAIRGGRRASNAGHERRRSSDDPRRGGAPGCSHLQGCSTSRLTADAAYGVRPMNASSLAWMSASSGTSTRGP
jgi:hypothetical protein